ncbi:MAG: bifunctional oligoribonuclease/PAP phosphatase NrnA [Candidatus Tectomicrobia bacterium]
MRHVIICQEQSLLAQGCPVVPDDLPVLYLVDDPSLQRKLFKAGYKALSGNLCSHRIYQRAHINHNDQFLIQVHNSRLTEDIIHRLWQMSDHPSVAVITENGASPALPPTVKHVSVAQLLCQASMVELRRARNHQMVQQLRDALVDVKNLLILMQHDPDPDAIASGLALRAVLGRNKTTAPLGSFGQVTRPENVTMVKLLDVKIEQITTEKLRQYDGIALVDVQPPYFGDALSEVDAVIDHHPLVAPYMTRYRDVRTDYGATATIFVQYLQAAGTKVTQRLATALYYGLKTDTMFLGRETTEADVEAFSYLYPQANHNLIRRMERPKLPLRDLDAFGYALRARTIIGSTFFTHLGMVEREDVLSQFAEFCLQVEEIERSVVSGIFKGNLVVSVRTQAHGKSAGELVRNAFGHLGSAGGHRCMAKAVIPLARLEQEFGRLSDAELGELPQDQMMQSLGMSVTV